jgi:hypothetical protein
MVRKSTWNFLHHSFDGVATVVSKYNGVYRPPCTWSLHRYYRALNAGRGLFDVFSMVLNPNLWIASRHKDFYARTVRKYK